MFKELRYLQAALVMFTRLPLASTQLQPQHFAKSSCYLPIVGLIVATLSIAVYCGLNYYLHSSTALLAALIIATLSTGAIHEDGFADCCDGFGAVPSQDRSPEAIEKILAIMKDSRLGTFAVLGLIAMFFSRWQLLQEIPSEGHILALLGLYSLAKIPALIIMTTLPYAQSQTTDSKMTLGIELDRRKTLLIILLTLATLLMLSSPALLLAQCIALALTTALLIKYFNHRLGGYNGDCLGASEQISGLICVLVFAFYF